MVKRNIPDWQKSAFDKDNNSCVKTKPFNKKLKELEAAYTKGKQTTVKVEGVDISILSLKEEPVKEEKDNRDYDLDKHQEERKLKMEAYLKKLREDETKIKFSGPARPDPNRGMRFINKFEPVNKGKLGHSKGFLKEVKVKKEYY